MNFEKFINQRMRFVGVFKEIVEDNPYKGLKRLKQTKDKLVIIKDVTTIDGVLFRGHVNILVSNKIFDNFKKGDVITFTAEIYRYNKHINNKTLLTQRLGLRDVNKIEKVNKFLIGISGKKASGKDTLANKIKDHFKNVEIVSWAKPLRDELTSIYNDFKKTMTLESISEKYEVSYSNILTLHNYYLQDVNLDFFTRSDLSRHILQYWGTDVRRKQDNNYWAKKSKTLILSLMAKGYNVVVPDTRFLNEVETIKRLNGKTIRLNIDKALQTERLLKRDGLLPKEDLFNHSSETSLDNYKGFDLIISSKSKEQDYSSIFSFLKK